MQYLSNIIFVSVQQVNYDLPLSTCDNLHNFTATEAEIHDTVSQFLTWRTILETVLKVGQMTEFTMV